MRNTKKRGNTKSRKVPGAPKPPLSSYMEFVKAERSSILNDLGKLPLVELGKELGKRWKNLSPEKERTLRA